MSAPTTHTHIGRRRRAVTALVAIAAALLATVALTACGDGGDAAGATTGGEAGGAYPVTLTHRHGTTTITAAPQRVVTLGYNEHDFTLALGVAPVAVRYWYGDEARTIRPWARDEADALGADPVVLNMPELDYEQIAAQDPDVILATYTGITKDEYERLSAIAPTVGPSTEYVDYGMPWRETLRVHARVLDRAERAEEIIAGLDAAYDRVRAEHPEFAGVEVAIASRDAETQYVLASQDLRARVLAEMGFTVPEEIDRLAGDRFYAQLSFEQTALLDRDLLIWDQPTLTPGGREAIEADPLVARLDAARDGRMVFFSGLLEEASGWNTVLSQPTVIKLAVPLLARALAG